MALNTSDFHLIRIDIKPGNDNASDIINEIDIAHKNAKLVILDIDAVDIIPVMNDDDWLRIVKNLHGLDRIILRNFEHINRHHRCGNLWWAIDTVFRMDHTVPILCATTIENIEDFQFLLDMGDRYNTKIVVGNAVTIGGWDEGRPTYTMDFTTELYHGIDIPMIAEKLYNMLHQQFPVARFTFIFKDPE